MLEDISLDKNNLEKFTRIGTSMKEKTKQDLVQFLRKSIQLNVYPSSRPVHQKKRVFAPERDNIVKEEVQKLTIMQFIREVYCLDWLANVIIVKKANGK